MINVNVMRKLELIRKNIKINKHKKKKIKLVLFLLKVIMSIYFHLLFLKFWLILSF